MCSVQNRGVASFAPKSLPTLPPQSMLAREDYPTSSRAYMKDKKTKVDLNRKKSSNRITSSPAVSASPCPSSSLSPPQNSPDGQQGQQEQRPPPRQHHPPQYQALFVTLALLLCGPSSFRSVTAVARLPVETGYRVLASFSPHACVVPCSSSTIFVCLPQQYSYAQCLFCYSFVKLLALFCPDTPFFSLGRLFQLNCV